MSHKAPGLPGLILPYGQTQGEEALATWKQTVATVYELDLAPENVANFRFGFSAWHFGSLVLGVSHSDEIKFWRSQHTVAQSGIDHYLVQVYEKARFGSMVEGRDMTVEAGDVWIVDMARTVVNQPVAFRSTNLAIPRIVLAPLLSNPDALHGLKLSATSAVGGLLSRYLRDLAKRAPAMEPDEANAVAQSTVHLIAGCVGPSLDANDMAREGLNAALLAKVKTYIETELGNPDLGPHLLCQKFGISRSNLYRMFARLEGVYSYIRSRRLARCFHHIMSTRNTPQRTSDIGAMWGFINESSFSRLFKNVYGMTPTELRNGGSQHIVQLGRDGANAAAEELGEWLQKLMRMPVTSGDFSK